MQCEYVRSTLRATYLYSHSITRCDCSSDRGASKGAEVTDGQPSSCFTYPSATNRSLLILLSDETNSTNSDTGTLPNCSATENCSRADNAASEGRRTRAFIWNKINNVTCLTLFYLLLELMSYHTFRVVYDKRENQHRSRAYQIPQIKIEGMFLYFFKELKRVSLRCEPNESSSSPSPHSVHVSLSSSLAPPCEQP